MKKVKPDVSALRPKQRRRRPRPLLWVLLALTAAEAVVVLVSGARTPAAPEIAAAPVHTPKPTPAPSKAGDIIAVDQVTNFDTAQTSFLIRHNYPAGVPDERTPVTKVTFHYRSQLPGGSFVTVYGRAYVPADKRTNLPTFAFAPGTTGIGDQCAASLEQPAKADWGSYDSHMAAYAVQGYAAVTTDYEGMRDTTRPHHYMVGELEGRALLDAVRALRQLPQSKNRLNNANVFLAGYSQGGHAAFWGDKISSRYAPDVIPMGVVGFGPVMSVEETLTDITHGANINWFGPNVLLSYRDYYGGTYPGVVLPQREAALTSEVIAHCIDTDLPYWGHSPAGIYTPEFIQAAATNTLEVSFPEFAQVLEANSVGAVSTPSAKLINGGAGDNVVLPAQQAAAMPALCSSSLGPVRYAQYPATTHYDTMVHSFNDTLAWMHTLAQHQAVPSSCK